MPQEDPDGMGGGAFRTTRWSVVLSAGDRDDPGGQEALARLCEDYWYPVYVFVRRSGRGADEARDLTQEYFARMIERRYLAGVEPGRARFRSFLLASVKHFLANARRDAAALKRGGGARPLSLDGEDPETVYHRQTANERTPEEAYLHQWANLVLDRARKRMASDLEAIGKAEQYEVARGHLGGGGEPLPYQRIAERLGVSVDAAKMTVSRLRKRFGRTLREEVAQTVEDPSQIDDEVRSLIAALR